MDINLVAKKQFGQHFLHDNSIINKIIAHSDIKENDNILEIGPGKGSLTSLLAKSKANIIGLEIDRDLINGPLKKFEHCTNVTILESDANNLNTNIIDLLGMPYKLISNLPYNAGTHILTSLLTSLNPPQISVVMLQREVANNICGKDSKLGILGAFFKSFANTKVLFSVRPSSFRPPPKVMSSVIKIDLLDNPLINRNQLESYKNFLYGGFSAPRKQLHNSLSHGLQISLPVAKQLISNAELDATIRPEKLTVENWVKLFEKFLEI